MFQAEQLKFHGQRQRDCEIILDFAERNLSLLVSVQRAPV